jgi:hypothetical protein
MDTSFKAVIVDSGISVLLGSNPRGERELLGGRAEPHDGGPEDKVRRELREEAGDEHIELPFFELAELEQLDLPQAYKHTIRLAQSQEFSS